MIMLFSDGQTNIEIAVAKLRTAAISFVMSVRPHATTWLPLNDFLKIYRENTNLITI
jgi:hypothetical protein